MNKIHIYSTCEGLQYSPNWGYTSKKQEITRKWVNKSKPLKTSLQRCSIAFLAWICLLIPWNLVYDGWMKWKRGGGDVWWAPMEEEPPWEHGSLFIMWRRWRRMKKMEENGREKMRGVKDERREIWEFRDWVIFFKRERIGDIYSGDS